MGFLKGPTISAPPPPPPPPPAAAPPTMASAEVGAAGGGAAARLRQAAGAGFDQTLQTGGRGLTAPATTAKKTLVGQ